MQKDHKLQKQLVAIQLATDSVKLIQQMSVVVATGLLWTAFTQGAQHLSDWLLWLALSCLGCTFVCCIWKYHNYIWSLALDGEVMTPLLHRLVFQTAYLSMVVGTILSIAFVLLRVPH